MVQMKLKEQQLVVEINKFLCKSFHFKKVWHTLPLKYKDKILNIVKSSHGKCSVKNGVLNKLTKFTGKQLYQSLIFNKVADIKK